jgi:hypothetical protein
MAINPNELILDRVREVILTDLTDGSVLVRLTSLEDSSLETTAEGTDVTDAIGSVITTLYRSKKASYSASNSLMSMDLLAAQYGTNKEVADITNKIITPVSEVLTAESGKITLSNIPTGTVKYIYKLVDKTLAKKYNVATTASTTEFSITGKDITIPTDETGTFYVEYEYAAESAVKVANKIENFPESVGVKIFGIFKNICNENIKYAGSVVAKKGKLDPSSITSALTSTGKHPFKINFNKDYCDDTNADLFSVIIAE